MSINSTQCPAGDLLSRAYHTSKGVSFTNISACIVLRTVVIFTTNDVKITTDRAPV
jgi:hypothetical protein